MKKSVLALSLVLALGIGFVGMPSHDGFVTPVCHAVEVANNADMITADGFGFMPAGRPAGQAKMMARRAAIMDAQRQLLEIVKGTAVDAESTMENCIVQSDVVKTKVSGMVTGAKVIKEEIESDGSYHVVLQVPAYGVGSVADAAITAKTGGAPAVPVPAPTPEFTKTYTPAPEAKVTGGYTGVVIVIKSPGLVRTFCPAIYDSNGRAVYGVHNVDTTFAINNGVVEYAKGQEKQNEVAAGRSRAGSNPLYIEIVSLRERVVNKCDVVISPSDADKILLENQRSGFLNKYNVVFQYNG
ncbi:MAG: LPP20 family lipoprotein [Phascolarctobacterium sp.]|nr:LPP20 family lipoprotein [Phascolarctobacterium sp.]